MAELTSLHSGYPALLEELKTRIRAAQLRAALSLIDRLAKDLGTEFPGVEGFSLRNLRYMRSFAEAWPDAQILQLAAKLPLGSSHGPAQSAQRRPEPRMVSAGIHRIRMEPQRSYPSHLNPAAGTRREGSHQLFANAAGKRRPEATLDEGSERNRQGFSPRDFGA